MFVQSRLTSDIVYKGTSKEKDGDIVPAAILYDPDSADDIDDDDPDEDLDI